MSFDGDVSSFLRMSGGDDGTGSGFAGYGNIRQRKINRHKAYYKQTQGLDIDPETGEILNYKPGKNMSNPYQKNMAYAKRYGGSSFNVNKTLSKLPNPSTLINLGLLAAIGIGGYKLYSKIFGDQSQNILDTKIDTGNKAVAVMTVDSNTAKVDTITATASSLSTKGLQVSDLHKSLANTIHGYINSMMVDEAKIIKTIKSQNVQTFRLMSVAYGFRTLPTYSFWHFTTNAQDKPLNLKDALKLVLSDSEQGQISSYLAVI